MWIIKIELFSFNLHSLKVFYRAVVWIVVWFTVVYQIRLCLDCKFFWKIQNKIHLWAFFRWEKLQPKPKKTKIFPWKKPTTKKNTNPHKKPTLQTSSLNSLCSGKLRMICPLIWEIRVRPLLYFIFIQAWIWSIKNLQLSISNPVTQLFICLLNSGFRELFTGTYSVTEICQMYGIIKIVFKVYFNIE